MERLADERASEMQAPLRSSSPLPANSPNFAEFNQSRHDSNRIKVDREKLFHADHTFDKCFCQFW